MLTQHFKLRHLKPRPREITAITSLFTILLACHTFPAYSYDRKQVSLTESTSTVSRSQVPGWPAGKVVHGSVSAAGSNPGDFNFDTLRQRPVDAVFTYAANGGNDSYNLSKVANPFKTKNLVAQARFLEKTYGSGRTVMPVIVVYTAGGSSGDSAIQVDLGLNPSYPDNLWLRMYNLVRIAQVAQGYRDPQHPVPATFIINPDFLGEVHKSCQQTYCPIPYQSLKLQLGSAITRAFEELQQDGFITSTPSLPSFLNSDMASFGDYLKSINWLIKTYAPDVSFGWQDNIWAGDSIAHRWIHKAASEVGSDSILQQHITAESGFLADLEIFDRKSPYRSDFIAFDKWERDNWDASLAQAGINNGYLYNGAAWDVYFRFVGGVARSLGNMPVMLFQLPGGHLQVKGDQDTRSDHASTAPTFLLGDPGIKNNLSNLKPYMFKTRFTHPEQDYDVSSPDIKTYLQNCAGSTEGGCQFDWQKGNINLLKQHNVFAILWGGGSTTSIAGMSQMLDDNGWLFERLQAVQM